MERWDKTLISSISGTQLNVMATVNVAVHSSLHLSG